METRDTLRPVGRLPERRLRAGLPLTTTDLQIHLRLVEAQLAVALVPELSGVRDRSSVTVHHMRGRPVRQIFAAVRRGASEHPAIRAFITATIRLHHPEPDPDVRSRSVRRGSGLAWRW